MSGETLLNLICDILDFSRIEAQKLLMHEQAFDLEETLERALQICCMSAAKKRINVAYTVDRGVPRGLVGDPGRLQQVLLNSLVNSLKFTPNGGSVSMCCGMRREDGAMRLHIAVTDTGIGISAEGLSKLFACFSQVDSESTPSRKYDGAGLGLAISRRLCEAMGGTMTAESAGPGQGSTFRISVLLREAPPTWGPRESPGKARPTATFLAGRRFVVVDSCEPVRDALARWLAESWGAGEVVVAADEQSLTEALSNGGAWDGIIVEATAPLLNAIKAHMTFRQAGPVPSVFALSWPSMELPALCTPGLARPTSFSGFEVEANDPVAAVAQCRAAELLPGCIIIPKPVRQSRLCQALAAVYAPELFPPPPRMKDSVSAASLADLEQQREQTAEGPARQLRGDAAARAQLRVLLAEDHAINQKVVIGLLKRYGHRVTCVAHDGVDALEKLRETAGGPSALYVEAER